MAIGRPATRFHLTGPGYPPRVDAKDSGRTLRRRIRTLRRKLRSTGSSEKHRPPQWQREPPPLKDDQFAIDAANAMGQSDPHHVDLHPDR